MIYLRLFYEFLKTGLFAVGGAMATLPFLYDISERTGWYTAEQLADMIAVSESTPGPIGINMATYVGFTTAGFSGALAATLGLILPGIIIILIIAHMLERFRGSKIVDAVFYGLRPCSVGLIAAAGLLVLKIALFNVDLFRETGLLADLLNYKAILLAAVLLVLTRRVKKTKGLHPIVFIAASAAIGALFSF